MIETKYGSYSEPQVEAFKEKLHKWIHWCLVYAEIGETDAEVLSYIFKTQKKLNGLNDILLDDPKVVEIMTLIESARIEFENHRKKTHLFRKLILDAHDVIDEICQADFKEE